MKEDPADAEVEILGEPKKIVKRNIFGRDKISLEQLKKKHQHQTVWYQYSPTSEKINVFRKLTNSYFQTINNELQFHIFLGFSTRTNKQFSS